MSSALDGVAAPPELFPPASPELPDVVFFFRWADVGGDAGAGRGPRGCAELPLAAAGPAR